MKLNITTIDAFTDKPFSGNPAAVCLLESPLTDEQMQLIAMEMNLSETAFVERTNLSNVFKLRWFTPTLEIDLCGHATLASFYWMMQSGWANEIETINFQTKSGELRVKSNGDFISMDFPLISTEVTPHGYFSNEFMGQTVVNAAKLHRNWILELENVGAVKSVVPDVALIAANSEEGIIVTSSGDGNYDICSRFFGPNVGVNEDPVTGFAHCALMDYWYKKTGKNEIYAFQASKRGGEMHLTKKGDRVIIKGQAVKVLSGEIEF
jgi:PhzF family phenazine biosynthesis protein